MSGLTKDPAGDFGRIGRSRQVAPRAVCFGYSFLQGGSGLEEHV